MKISTKNLIKILTILLIIVTLISVASPVVFALDSPNELVVQNVDDAGLGEKAGRVMGMIRNFAIIASVIVLMVLGVKYIIGSVEEKAEYKKSFFPLIIGIVIVVSATTIASFIFSIAE